MLHLSRAMAPCPYLVVALEQRVDPWPGPSPPCSRDTPLQWQANPLRTRRHCVSVSLSIQYPLMCEVLSLSVHGLSLAWILGAHTLSKCRGAVPGLQWSSPAPHVTTGVMGLGFEFDLDTMVSEPGDSVIPVRARGQKDSLQSGRRLAICWLVGFLFIFSLILCFFFVLNLL